MAENKVIMVVEDERPLQAVIQDKLKSSGYETVTARDVAQAIQYLEELPRVDAIWLDHYLIGREDGLDLVAKLKAHEGEWSRIPVFVVTNTAGPDKLQTYIQLGVDKYYIKADHRLDEIVEDITSALENGSE